jgi:hypothetical protein
VYGGDTVTNYSDNILDYAYGNDFTGIVCNPISIVFDIMVNRMGMSTSDIDLDKFNELAEDLADQEIGFANPAKATDEFPTFKDMITQILQTCMLRMYLNTDNKWSLSVIEPNGSSDVTITDHDLRKISFELDYEEIMSDIIVEYAPRDVSENPNEFDGLGKRVTASSDTAKYVHNTFRQKTFYSIHTLEASAQTLADRLSYVFGDRRGRFVYQAGISESNRKLGDIVTLSRERLLGFSHTEGTEQTRDVVVIQTDKTVDSVTITVDDQKGIEDNSGSW